LCFFFFSVEINDTLFQLISQPKISVLVINQKEKNLILKKDIK